MGIEDENKDGFGDTEKVVELAKLRSQKEEIPKMLEQAIDRAIKTSQELDQEAIAKGGGDLQHPEALWRQKCSIELANLNVQAQAALTALQKKASSQTIEEAGVSLRKLHDRLTEIDKWRYPDAPKPTE